MGSSGPSYLDQSNFSTVAVQMFSPSKTKSIPKTFISHNPDLDVPSNRIDSQEPAPNDGDESNESSIYLQILIPIALVVLLIGLATFARWRYRVGHRRQVNGKCRTLDNNNDISKAEDGRIAPQEEFQPLKNRNISTSSSSSTVSRNILTAGSKPITVSMRIVSDKQNQEILGNSRTELYCEINTKDYQKPFEDFKETTSNSLPLECEVLKENRAANLSSNEDRPKKEASKSVKFSQKEITKDAHPQRPKTLEVMTVVDSSESSNTNCSKGFPWTEQEWTPDADIIYEDTGSPENTCALQKEEKDRLFPLMAKKKFKMKPKGLLERRGSNVALTISLKSDDKTCASPPPSSKSPKPLVYLRTATAKLDPVQLHIKAADAQRLQQEFWDVPMNHPSEKHFSIPGYGTKNRYRSILPNPHSRVLLPVTPCGDPLSAYINANYVRGYSAMSESERRKHSEDGKENDARRMSMKRKAGFIATQGPLANTIVDFWKMVWRENSTAIIMITKLKERKEKCTEYLPIAAGETRTYGEFNLEVKNIRYADHYTVRTIEVRNTAEEDEVRTVMHYWYAEWLDHETPDKLRSLLTLVQEVDLRCPDMPNTDHGPVVVHCSAGIGRTGCFIAISIGCRQLRAEGKVDPLRIICQLRMDRGGMIQTWEQYQYVHVALSRYARILAGETVNTPLTGSSRTPDSWSSSRHTTPNSGDFKSPLSGQRLFSPRLFPKSDLTTVEESENAASDSERKPTPRSADQEKSIFSPRPVKTKQKSRFSFSSVEDAVAPPGDEANKEETPIEETTNSKRTKKCPPQLDLKLNPKPTSFRDENWLINGHCTVVEDEASGDTNESKTSESKPSEPSFTFASEDFTVEAPVDGLGNEDLGKLRNILSPTSKECQTPNGKEQKSPVFMFPSPDK